MYVARHLKWSVRVVGLLSDSLPSPATVVCQISRIDDLFPTLLFIRVVVVIGLTPPSKNGGGVQQPFLRTPADGIPPSNENSDPLVDWWAPPFSQKVPHLHGNRPQIRDL